MRTPPEYHPNKKPTFPLVKSDYLNCNSTEDIQNVYNKNVEIITDNYNKKIDAIFEKHKEEFCNNISVSVKRDIDYVFNKIIFVMLLLCASGIVFCIGLSIIGRLL